jgi:DNA-binding MarR family transcriptional regulator
MKAKIKREPPPLDQPFKDEAAEQLRPGAPLEDYLPYQLFRIVNRLTLNLRGNFRPLKITLSRWRVLSTLTARDGRSIGQLADFMVMEQPALSRVIDQMERDLLVVRRLASDDNRVVRVYLTAAGRSKFEDIRPLEIQHYQNAIDGIEQEDLEQLSGLLQRVWENIDRQGASRVVTDYAETSSQHP